MNKALLASCALVGTLALASITARAECIDREQAFREYRHLADGALPCNNGKGVQMINGEAVRAKPLAKGKERLTGWPLILTYLGRKRTVFTSRASVYLRYDLAPASTIPNRYPAGQAARQS